MKLDTKMQSMVQWYTFKIWMLYTDNVYWTQGFVTCFLASCPAADYRLLLLLPPLPLQQSSSSSVSPTWLYLSLSLSLPSLRSSSLARSIVDWPPILVSSSSSLRENATLRWYPTARGSRPECKPRINEYWLQWSQMNNSSAIPT